MQLADRVPDIENTIDDTSDIDTDIASLSKRYIFPIDQLRSISRPDIGKQTSKGNSNAITKATFNNLKINNSVPMESRAHAFYRMIGFPVAVTDNSFYNPGFDPSNNQAIDKKQSINSKIETSLQSLMNLRETFAQDQRQIFANQDLSSSVYALLLRYPIVFKILADGKGPFDVDNQFFKADHRDDYANFLTILNPQLADNINAVSGKFIGAKHILKPFIVDPKIDVTVMPDSNLICVPFLANKNATKINDNVFASRPGIEFIIRQRLSDQVLNTSFLDDITKVIKNEKSAVTTNLDKQTIVDTIEALSAENKIDFNELNSFNFSTTQISMVTTLIKTIKAVVEILYESMLIIDLAKTQINWFPMPSISGPETGAIGASLNRVNTSSANSKIDNIITELRIKKLNAETQLNQQQDLGNFATPFVGSSKPDSIKVFNDQLQEQVQKRDGIAKDAFKAMGFIEVIMGEISGLGLIDVLSIYTALWALDTDVLIGFLDDNAFQRMIDFNPDFANITEVASRKSGTKMSITDVLSKFESKLSNLLSFADKVLENQLLSPIEVINGSTE